MIKTLRKIGDATDKFMSVIVVLLSATMIAACVLQVFTRYVLNNSLSWTEELARYVFISVTMISASTCTKNGSHATITFLIDILPKKAAKVIVFFGNFFVCFASAVVIRYGLAVAKMTANTFSTALHIPKPVLYYMVVIGAVGILIQTLVNMLVTLCGFLGMKEEEAEQ